MTSAVEKDGAKKGEGVQDRAGWGPWFSVKKGDRFPPPSAPEKTKA